VDTQLIRTFLEIITAGSFIETAARVNVTQSAVSLRVKRLEEELGQTLFTRSKSGIELTPAGEKFERFARSLLKVWEEAKYQVAVPDEYTDILSIGCQHSLWPKLGGRWLRLLEKQLPGIAFKAEVGMPERLMRMMVQGTTDIAVMYTPQARPGLRVEELIKEELILVSPDADYPAQLDSRYVFMDWGPEFAAMHAIHFIDFDLPRTSLAIGSLGINFIVDQDRAGYFPARLVKQQLDAGLLHVVRGAPVFPFPAYVIWNSERDQQLIGSALTALRTVAGIVDVEQDGILEDAVINLDSVGAKLQS
jgi:DNA-binding transcriptional LysR family regulator